MRTMTQPHHPNCRAGSGADSGGICRNCGDPVVWIKLRVQCPDLLRVGTNAILRLQVDSLAPRTLTDLSVRLANGRRFLTKDSDDEQSSPSLPASGTRILEFQITPARDGRVRLDLVIQHRDHGRDDWIYSGKLYIGVAPKLSAGSVSVNVDTSLVPGGITANVGGQEVLVDPGAWGTVPLTQKERVRFEPRPIDVGTELGGGRYRVERLLGRGAFGGVFRAVGQGPGREGRSYAIKTLRTELRDSLKLRRSFEREAELTARLTHPNIVRLWDTAAHDGVPYLVMEYLEGPTGDELLAESPAGLPVDEVVRIGIGLCRALDHAHEHRVFHRDIKPSNLMLAGDGTPKLTDFNLARVVKTQMSHLSDKGGSGTVAYMSMEQIRNEPPTPQQDLWSLGVTLVELLTGETPFAGSADQVLVQIREGIVGPLEGVPDWLNEAILRCLATEPAKPWTTAGELRAALERGSRRAASPVPTTAEPTRAAAAEAPAPSSEDFPRDIPPGPPSGGGRRTALYAAGVALLFLAVFVLAKRYVPWGASDVPPEPVTPEETTPTPGVDCGPYEPLDPTPDNPAGITWVTIEGGEFTMGPDGCPKREGYDCQDSTRSEIVDDFQLSMTEVTVGQFELFMNSLSRAERERFEPGWGGLCNWQRDEDGWERDPMQPINCITWEAAEAFAGWAGGRLVGEAEWEFGARAGRFHDPGVKFAWSDASGVDCKHANSSLGQGGDVECGSQTTQVCSHASGRTAGTCLCDMTGNVFEFVQEPWSQCLDGSISADEPVHSPDVLRILRGGSFDTAHEESLSIRCRNYAPRQKVAEKQAAFGFRIARGLPGRETSETEATTRRFGDLAIDWVWVPGGAFYPPGSEELTRVEGFWISSSEISVEQYDPFVAAYQREHGWCESDPRTRCPAPGNRMHNKNCYWCDTRHEGDAGLEKECVQVYESQIHLPVNCVNEQKTRDYAAWVEAGIRDSGSKVQVRRPTATQWEFAHRFERTPETAETRFDSGISDLEWNMGEWVVGDEPKTVRWGRWGRDVEVAHGTDRDVGNVIGASAGGGVGFRLVLTEVD